MNNHKKIKIAAIGDLHVNKESASFYAGLFTEISKKADVLILCGDLTDQGTNEEAQILATDISLCKIPVVAILGNHDYHSDKQLEIKDILCSAGAHVLQGEEYVFEKEGKKYAFVGVKGFGGGFRPHMWGRFGEKEQKDFYDAVAPQVQDLENGLNKAQSIDTDKVIVLTHFSPIRDTLKGELEELYAFLGSSKLEEVIDRYEVDIVFHGHSHFGCLQGKTLKGIPVYNASQEVVKKYNKGISYFLIEV